MAFVLFGLLSTLNFYNSEATFRQTLRDTNVSAVQLTKQYSMISIWYQYGEEQHSYEGWNQAKFTPAEVEQLASQLNPDAFGACEYGGSFNIRQLQGNYWQNYIRSFASLPANSNLRNQLRGEYPQKKGEIALSSYFADMMLACNAYDSTGTAMELNSVDELFGKNITINGREFKITGIMDSGMIPPEFESLKDSGQIDYSLQSKLLSVLESGLHLLVFVSDDQLTEFAQEYSYYKEGRENYMRIASGFMYEGEYKMSDYSNARYNGVSTLPSNQKFFAISKAGTDLAEDEIILPTNQFLMHLGELFSSLGHDANNSENYILAEFYYGLSNKAWELQSGGIWEYPESNDDKYDKESKEEKGDKEEMQEPIFRPFSDEDYEKRLTELLKAAKDAGLEPTIGLQLYDDWNQGYIGEIQIFKVVGLFRQDQDKYEQTFYISDAKADALWEEQRVRIPDYYDSVTNYVEAPDAIYTTVYLPGNVPEEKIDAYWEVYSNDEFGADSTRITMGGGMISALQMVDSFVESMSQVFLYVGLVLAVFAALLLSNFISVSISNKKREIGILRAVGARSLDVFKIFFSESFVIGLICVLVSSGASYWLCNMINQEYSADLGASVFVFGIPSIAVLIGIAAITIVIATFLPVYNAARKKPVESIRAL